MMTQVMKWFIKDNEIWPVFKSDKSVKFAGRLSFLLLVFYFGLFLFTLKRLPPQVPLFYSLPWGEEQLVPTMALFFLPLGIFLIALLNFLLAMVNFKAYPLAAKILIWITVCLIFLTSINLVKIVFLIY